MNSKLVRFMFLGMVSIVVAALPALALNDANNYTRSGTTVYDEGAILDVRGALKIDGTTVTATAAQLNAAATGTVTNGVLNPSVVSNSTLFVSASNLTVTTALTIPAQSIAASKIATNAIGALIVTNLSTLSTNIMWFNAQGILTNCTRNP